MRILVTGSSGFAGCHLVRDLISRQWTVAGMDLSAVGGLPGADYFQVDARDSEAVAGVVRAFQPEAVIHLCGMAFVPDGWDKMEDLFAVNLTGTINVLQSCRRHAPGAKVLVISSAEVYGARKNDSPVDESAPLHPANPYAVSKSAAEQIALAYAEHYSLAVVVARPGNHIGPGQSRRFVLSAFAAQLKAIAAGKCPPILKVGNLDSRRDFTDVRDVVRAYRLLIEKGMPSHAYNIASGREISIRAALEQLCLLAGVCPRIEVDEARFRASDPRPLLDTSKITRHTGWKAQIDMAATLRDIMASSPDSVPQP